MKTTPLAEQIRIVLFGLRNSGKSSLMNNLFEKDVAIVSDMPGTTTDPVTRSMELDKLGAVAVTDTAGFDDTGVLGELRIKKTIQRCSNADIIVLVTAQHREIADEEKEFLDNIKDKNNVIIALTFADKKINEDKKKYLSVFSTVVINNITKNGVDELKRRLISLEKSIYPEITPVEGLVKENDFVILVTPIDLAAPKSRLILPQVETIRDLLDKDCGVMILKERELKYFYDKMGIKPKLVIADSQAFSKVAADLPEDQLLTSFSILFARKKGDLSFFVNGVKNLKTFKPGSKVLVLESCNHHKKPDDIGTIKIPRLFKQLVSSKVHFDFVKNLPDEKTLKEYSFVINCAGCMVTKNQMMGRISILKDNDVFGINYGLFLAWSNGLLPRALKPFPYEYDLYNQ